MLMAKSDDEGNITLSGITKYDKKNEGKCRGILKDWVPVIVDGGMGCRSRLIGMETCGEIKE